MNNTIALNSPIPWDEMPSVCVPGFSTNLDRSLRKRQQVETFAYVIEQLFGGMRVRWPSKGEAGMCWVFGLVHMQLAFWRVCIKIYIRMLI